MTTTTPPMNQPVYPTFATHLLTARHHLTLPDEIGLALRAHRHHLHHSQRAYAAHRHWTQSHIARLETAAAHHRLADIIDALHGTGYRLALIPDTDTPATPATPIPATHWPTPELIARVRGGRRRFPAHHTTHRTSTPPHWWLTNESTHSFNPPHWTTTHTNPHTDPDPNPGAAPGRAATSDDEGADSPDVGRFAIPPVDHLRSATDVINGAGTPRGWDSTELTAAIETGQTPEPDGGTEPPQESGPYGQTDPRNERVAGCTAGAPGRAGAPGTAGSAGSSAEHGSATPLRAMGGSERPCVVEASGSGDP